MGATTPYMTLRNRQGQTITVNLYYAGGDAAGYIVPCSMSGVASSGSPQDFVLPDGEWTIQYITGPATGKIRLWANGSPGPIALDMATVIAAVASGNTYGKINGGSRFRFSIIVEAAMAA